MRILYFIAIKGHEDLGVKIGSSTNPKYRMHQIQYNCPGQLYIIHEQAETPGLNERSVHRMLDSYNIHGEWFTYSNELKDLLMKLKGNKG